jgi:4-diphosphocytidyl-2-C-methyl-D-erythritol kinase
MAAERAISVRAFAKINLQLRVIGTRSDGYHDLRTVFQSISLHDTLTMRSCRGPFDLQSDDPACPGDRTNLIWQAAERLWTAAGRRGAPRGLTVRLRKRIPAQAGLGGGSSDAAAALVALGRRWRVGAGRLREVAASLGADVPYFLEGGTVLGLGRGDALFPLVDAPRFWVTLAIPSFRVSTSEAFAWWDAAPRPERHDAGSNDLEPVVGARHPEIGRLAALLRVNGATDAAMSGSGSTVFGLFRQRADALGAARALRGADRAVLVARTVGRREYRRGAGHAAR